jgi:hypothetical protein
MTAMFAAQDALIAALEAQSPDCRVSLGYPVPVGNFPEEGIWVLISGSMNVESYMTGGCSRSEDITLRVRIWAKKRGGTAKTARDRAATLYASLEAALAADHTLGGVCTFAAVESVKAEDEAIEGTSVEFGLEVTVSVQTAVA